MAEDSIKKMPAWDVGLINKEGQGAAWDAGVIDKEGQGAA